MEILAANKGEAVNCSMGHEHRVKIDALICDEVAKAHNEDKLGLTFLQIASLKLQASILETIPVKRESDLR